AGIIATQVLAMKINAVASRPPLNFFLTMKLPPFEEHSALQFTLWTACNWCQFALPRDRSTSLDFSKSHYVNFSHLSTSS
ncbi:MAG: hypothetical protein ACLPKZ_07875, partial [Acidimicrobiales bacterium]